MKLQSSRRSFSLDNGQAVCSCRSITIRSTIMACSNLLLRVQLNRLKLLNRRRERRGRGDLYFKKINIFSNRKGVIPNIHLYIYIYWFACSYNYWHQRRIVPKCIDKNYEKRLCVHSRNFARMSRENEICVHFPSKLILH